MSPARRGALTLAFGVLAVLVLLAVVLRLVAEPVGDTESAVQPEGESSAAPAGVPDPPAGLAGVGSWVESTVDADGDVTVEQWIRSAVSVDRLQLTTADPDSFPGTVESSEVEAQTFDGTKLASRRGVGTRTLNVRLRQPATDIYLSYTIAGATLSEEASTVPGRSVARVVGMDVVFDGEDGPTTRVVRFEGGTVLSGACLDPAAGYEAPPVACGAPTTDGGWQIELDGADRHDRIIASLMTG